MRRKHAIFSMGASLLYQIAAVLCGFLVQRIMLGHYGSTLVGLTASITKFLGFITLIEAGIGGIVNAALYKPLADKDQLAISGIVISTNRFFRRIAGVMAIYIVFLGLVFPSFNDTFSLSDGYIFLLTVSIGLSTFMQYYLGMTNQLLLQADQKQYIPTTLNIITTVLNTLIIALLVFWDMDILYVKLTSSLVFALKPIMLFLYCKKNYKLTKTGTASELLNTQKWSGFGHHLSYFIHTSTDIGILTLCGRYGEVAVYSLYIMITGSLTNIIDCACGGIQSAFGNVLANNDQELLCHNFDVFEAIIHMLVTVIFGTAALMILPFMRVYTAGLTDIEYILPLFGFICVLQDALFCLRRPYVMIISAAGHYKQTQVYAYLEAAINIILSCVLISKNGLAGLAFATAFAMLFRLIMSVLYLRKNILNRSIKHFGSCIICDIFALTPVIVLYVLFYDALAIKGYLGWIVCAVTVFILLSFSVLLSYRAFNGRLLKAAFSEVRRTMSIVRKVVPKQ